MSVFAGLIAANLPDGSEVLTATGDFTSILFPFYAQSGRGIRVREVPLDRIAECVTSRTTLVAVSAVQSADGRVADLDALHAASRATGARVLLDTTQAVGWLPVNPSRFAYTACGGYKAGVADQRPDARERFTAIGSCVVSQPDQNRFASGVRFSAAVARHGRQIQRPGDCLDAHRLTASSSARLSRLVRKSGAR